LDFAEWCKKVGESEKAADPETGGRVEQSHDVPVRTRFGKPKWVSGR